MLVRTGWLFELYMCYSAVKLTLQLKVKQLQKQNVKEILNSSKHNADTWHNASHNNEKNDRALHEDQHSSITKDYDHQLLSWYSSPSSAEDLRRDDNLSLW